jgi:hypothetical protein
VSDIPEAVKETLRREVGYGCPICRSPFLEFHHFDPPRRIEDHNRPEGMIALCLDCHPDADERGTLPGNYSKAELHALKRKPYSSEDVKGHFPSWKKKSLLVRIGGVYTDTSAPIIAVNGMPQITLAKNEADLLCLSFELRNKDGNLIAKMDKNCFECHPSNIHDMTIRPKRKDVKVWLTKDDIGLELTFDRISMARLEERLAEDKRRREKAGLYRGLEDSDSDIRFERSITQTIKDWAASNCLDDDGLIPFLDFREMALYYPCGTRVEIRNGVAHVIHYDAEFNNSGSGSAVNVNCHCSICELRRPRHS